MDNKDTFQLLKQYLMLRVPVSEEECEEVLSYFNVKRIKRKQFIIQPEFVAKHRNYVVKGAFKAYVINENGNEHTIQFAIEDWWISDYNSYIYQKPATMFVAALEDSVVLQIDYQSEQALKKANHKYEMFFRILAERAAAYQQRRIISMFTQTAEERYNDFIVRYPLAVQRLPQYVLASYLGMTTEFLSKIRNNKLKKNS